MKKLILLLAMVGVGPIICTEKKPLRPSFGIPWSKYKKSAYWMRPNTQAWDLLEKGESIPEGYVLDEQWNKDFATSNPDDPTRFRKIVKRLPVSGREEFWNKFISGYSDDKAVEEEMRLKKGTVGMSTEQTREHLKWYSNPEIRQKYTEMSESESKFLAGIEKETPQSYVKPEKPKIQPLFSPFEQLKAPTGFFSGLRNWFNKYFGSGTTIYTPAKPTSVPYTPKEPTSVPFQYPESE